MSDDLVRQLGARLDEMSKRLDSLQEKIARAEEKKTLVRARIPR